MTGQLVVGQGGRGEVRLGRMHHGSSRGGGRQYKKAASGRWALVSLVH